MVPVSYDAWRHYMTLVHRIPLTSAYCDERIATLQDLDDCGTRVLVAVYGETHRQRLLSWFSMARRTSPAPESILRSNPEDNASSGLRTVTTLPGTADLDTAPNPDCGSTDANDG